MRFTTPLPHCRRGASCRAVAAALVAAGPPSFTQRGRYRRHARSGRNAQLLPGRPAYRWSSETQGCTATSSNTAPCPDAQHPRVSPASTPAIARTPTGSSIGGTENAPPRATAPRLPLEQPHDADHADVDPDDMPEPEDPEGIAAEYQQMLALVAGDHPLEGASYHRPPRRRGPSPTARAAEPPRWPVAIPSQNRRATRPVEGRGCRGPSANSRARGPPLGRPRRRPRRVETVGDLFLFAPSDLVRNNPPVVAGGRITAHPRWSRVRRKWVQPEVSRAATPKRRRSFASGWTAAACSMHRRPMDPPPPPQPARERAPRTPRKAQTPVRETEPTWGGSKRHRTTLTRWWSV